ncbi:MAG: hypothetical protein KC473_01855, partial [Candidatus Dadabacteria bacterium]|nr:hypothetical protein [Candidatus Dadabacteria bacterium]
MKNPVILIAALVIVLGAMFYLHNYSKRGGNGDAEAPQVTANTFTLGERIEIPHAGHGHEVHVSGP